MWQTAARSTLEDMEFYNVLTTAATGVGILFVAVLAVAPSWMELRETRRTSPAAPDRTPRSDRPVPADLPAHPDQYDRAA